MLYIYIKETTKKRNQIVNSSTQDTISWVRHQMNDRSSRFDFLEIKYVKEQNSSHLVSKRHTYYSFNIKADLKWNKVFFQSNLLPFTNDTLFRLQNTCQFQIRLFGFLPTNVLKIWLRFYALYPCPIVFFVLFWI